MYDNRFNRGLTFLSYFFVFQTMQIRRLGLDWLTAIPNRAPCELVGGV
jgi:hypothetical protein